MTGGGGLVTAAPFSNPCHSTPTSQKERQLEIWANAQPDGRPAE